MRTILIRAAGVFSNADFEAPIGHATVRCVACAAKGAGDSGRTDRAAFGTAFAVETGAGPRRAEACAVTTLVVTGLLDRAAGLFLDERAFWKGSCQADRPIGTALPIAALDGIVTAIEAAGSPLGIGLGGHTTDIGIATPGTAAIGTADRPAGIATRATRPCRGALAIRAAAIAAARVPAVGQQTPSKQRPEGQQKAAVAPPHRV